MSGSLRWLAVLFLVLFAVCFYTGAWWGAALSTLCQVGVAVVAWHERSHR